MRVTLRTFQEWLEEYDGSTAPPEMYQALILALKKYPKPRRGSASKTVRCSNGAYAAVTSLRVGPHYDVQMYVGWQGLRWYWRGRMDGTTVLDYRSPRLVGN